MQFNNREDIIAITPFPKTQRRMQIYWGVRPLKSYELDSMEDICNGAIELAKAKQYIDTGDTILLISGIPSPNVKRQQTGLQNTMTITVV